MKVQWTKPPLALTRRQCLAATGVGVLALGLSGRGAVAASATIRQGYQTNIWGMPTYYLLKSGYLEKHGIAVEEFPVPSGNLPEGSLRKRNPLRYARALRDRAKRLGLR